MRFAADTTHGQEARIADVYEPDDPAVIERIGEDTWQALQDDIELLDEAGEAFDMEKVNSGELTPMFFGSAMTNFGVQDFLEGYIRMAPTPQPRLSAMASLRRTTKFSSSGALNSGQHESGTSRPPGLHPRTSARASSSAT